MHRPRCVHHAQPKAVDHAAKTGQVCSGHDQEKLHKQSTHADEMCVPSSLLLRMEKGVYCVLV